MGSTPYRRFGEYVRSDCDRWMNGETDEEDN